MFLCRFFNFVYLFIFFCTINASHAMWESNNDLPPPGDTGIKSSDILSDDALSFLAQRIHNDCIINTVSLPTRTIALLGFRTSNDVKLMDDKKLYAGLRELRENIGPEFAKEQILQALTSDNRGNLHEDFMNYKTPTRKIDQHTSAGAPSAPPQTSHSNQAGRPTTIAEIAWKLKDIWWFLGEKFNVDSNTLESIRLKHLMTTDEGANELFNHLHKTGDIDKNIAPEALWQVLSNKLAE